MNNYPEINNNPEIVEDVLAQSVVFFHNDDHAIAVVDGDCVIKWSGPGWYARVADGVLGLVGLFKSYEPNTRYLPIWVDIVVVSRRNFIGDPHDDTIPYGIVLED